MPTPAEELARRWWRENVGFRGDHTGGMYMNARDYVDVVMWATDMHPPDFTGEATEEEAIGILTPIAQRYLDEQEAV